METYNIFRNHICFNFQISFNRKKRSPKSFSWIERPLRGGKIDGIRKGGKVRKGWKNPSSPNKLLVTALHAGVVGAIAGAGFRVKIYF